jgi:hypothetical protein
MDPLVIAKNNIILVEGIDELNFIPVLCENIQLENYQIVEYHGKDSLGHFLDSFIKTPGNHLIESIGIICDADDDFNRTFEIIKTALEENNLPTPLEPIMPSEGSPIIRLFIMPDNENPGMLESLCFQSVQEDLAVPCVESYFQCLEERSASTPNIIEKARIQVYLASRPLNTIFLGAAANEGYWNIDNECFSELKRFLTEICARTTT